MASWTLSVGGSSVDLSAGTVELVRAELRVMDASPESLEFTEWSETPTYDPWSEVILSIDGTTRFVGRIVSAGRNWSDKLGPVWSYRCLGGKWLIRDVRVTHPQSERAEVAYNLSPDDPDYDEDLANLELGDILKRVLTYPAIAEDIWNSGVEAFTAAPTYDPSATLKSATVSDLAAMTVVPTRPVYLTGRLWPQVESLLQEWMPSHVMAIQPDGTIRFFDISSPTEKTLTFGTDPIERPSISIDTTECYSRVQVVGSDHVEGAYVSLLDGTLAEAWSGAEESAWVWADFAEPGGAISEGTVSSVSATSVTITPTSGATTWDANRWSNDRAMVTLEDPSTQNTITFSESRRVTANTAVSGGSSTLTLDYPLANSGYTRYKLIGRPTSGLAVVHRKYTIEDTYIEANVVERFPIPQPFSTIAGTNDVSAPVGINQWSSSGDPDYFEQPLYFSIETDPTSGLRVIITNIPTCKLWTDQSYLDSGDDANINKPSNILCFLPVSKGLLTATAPSSGYSGKGYTDYGIQRTLYLYEPEWRYKGDQTRMEDYAASVLATVQDPVVSGTVIYYGLYSDAFTDNLALNLAKAGGTTGFEDMAASVRSVLLEWPADGPFAIITRLQVSNLRKPWTGEQVYTPGQFLQGDPLAGAFLDARGAGGLSGASGSAFGSVVAAQIAAVTGNPAAAAPGAAQGWSSWLGWAAQAVRNWWLS